MLVRCRKTPDGSAYTLDFPWGNTGSILNGVCLSAVYQKLAIDPASSEAAADNRCFIQRQLGYFFNHKCTTTGSACNTPTDEGFSYMVGCATTLCAWERHLAPSWVFYRSVMCVTNSLKQT